MTRLLLHAGTCSSLLSRAFWERPLSNLLLVFGPELSTDLWADHLQGELTTSWLPPHDRPRGVVPRASIAEKRDLLCLLSPGRCGPLSVHPSPSGKCSPSVVLIAPSVPPLNAGNVVPTAPLHLQRARSFQGFISCWETSAPQDSCRLPCTYNHRRTPRSKATCSSHGFTGRFIKGWSCAKDVLGSGEYHCKGIYIVPAHRACILMGRQRQRQKTTTTKKPRNKSCNRNCPGRKQQDIVMTEMGFR